MTPIQVAIKITIGLAAPTLLALVVDFLLRHGTLPERTSPDHNTNSVPAEARR